MEARANKLPDFRIHSNVTMAQSHQLLLEIIFDVKRRVGILQESMRLFGEHTRLRNKIKRMHQLNVDLMTYRLWMLRESSVPGLLVIDYAKLQPDQPDWVTESVRLALTDKGWRSVRTTDTTENIVGFKPVNQYLASEHAESLMRFLAKNGFFFHMLVLPENHEPQNSPSVNYN